jgi:hypothetical protein
MKANGGVEAGCLKSTLTDDYALRLSLPITKADLMAAHRRGQERIEGPVRFHRRRQSL